MTITYQSNPNLQRQPMTLNTYLPSYSQPFVQAPYIVNQPWLLNQPRLFGQSYQVPIMAQPMMNATIPVNLTTAPRMEVLEKTKKVETPKTEKTIKKKERKEKEEKKEEEQDLSPESLKSRPLLAPLLIPAPLPVVAPQVSPSYMKTVPQAIGYSTTLPRQAIIPSPTYIYRPESDLYYTRNEDFFEYDLNRVDRPILYSEYNVLQTPSFVQTPGFTHRYSPSAYEHQYNPLTHHDMSLNQEIELEKRGGLAKQMASLPVHQGTPIIASHVETVAIVTGSSNVGYATIQALLSQNRFIKKHPDRKIHFAEKMKNKIINRKYDDIAWGGANFSNLVFIRSAIHDTSKVPYVGNFADLEDLQMFSGVDATIPSSLDSVFYGTQKALIVPSQSSRRVEHCKALIDAAKRNGVRHVVLVSILGAETESFYFAKQFREIERYLENSGLIWTHLRCAFFFQNLYMMMTKILRDEVLPLPAGAAKWAPVDILDIGRAAAVILASSGHEFKTYNITGPISYNGSEIAQIMGHSLHLKLKYVDQPPEEYKNYLVQHGMPSWQADGIVELFNFFKTGYCAQVTPDLNILLGGSTTLQDWLHRNKTRFQMKDQPHLPALSHQT